MSFFSQLEIDEKVYNVLDCDYSFHQSIDKNNKPSSTPRGGQITVLIEARGVANFLKWITEHTHTKDGKITFYRRDQVARMFHLSFSKAFCTDYIEYFNHHSDEPMQIKMTISAKEITAENTVFENKWAIA